MTHDGEEKRKVMLFSGAPADGKKLRKSRAAAHVHLRDVRVQLAITEPSVTVYTLATGSLIGLVLCYDL